MRRVAELSFDDARRKAPIGPPLTVLPDAARVEEHLVRRATPFVAGQVACTLLQLERELVRNARADGACPKVASPEALALLFRDVCREETPREGPFWGIRDQPGFARAAQDLMSALAQGLIEPAELLRLPLPETARERIVPLATLLVRAQKALDRRGLADPNRALRLAVDALADGGALPPMVRSAPELTFEAILDWTPLRVRMVAALAARMRVRVRLPWSAQPDLREAVEPALRAFESLGGAQAVPDLELFDPSDGSPLEGFLHALFGGAGPARGAPVTLRACASPAAQARDDALDGGYAERLRALAARLVARARSRASEAIDPAAAASTLEDATRAAAEVGEVAARVQSILADVRSLPDRATLRAHGDALLALLDRWGMPSRLRRGEHEPGSDEPGPFSRAAAAALARDQAALRALEEACRTLAEGAAELGDADRAFARGEWVQALTSALGAASLPAGGARGGAVQLAELRELTGRRFD